MFGKSVERQVGFLEEQKPRHSTGAGKLVPHRFAHRLQTQLLHEGLEHLLQSDKVLQPFPDAPVRINDPFHTTLTPDTRHRTPHTSFLSNSAFLASNSSLVRTPLTISSCSFSRVAVTSAAVSAATGFGT